MAIPDIETLRRRALELWNRLRLSPSRASLSGWLAFTNAAVVVIVVGGVSLAAIDRLRDLANAQGLARVQLAGAAAREELRRLGEDTLTSARVLAERPALQRLLTEGRSDALEPVLRRFCQTSGIDSCAVLSGSTLLAQVGTPLPWSGLLAASAEQGEQFFALAPALKTAVQGAVAPVALQGPGPILTPLTPNETKVAVARLLDGKLAASLSARAGVEIRLIDYRSFSDAPVGDFTALHSAGLADGRSAADRIDPQRLYAASVPVFASTGEAIALIEARLPTQESDNIVRQLVRRLLITAIVLAILAVAAGILMGQRVAGPVEALKEAAVRLGQGDFSTSIPVGGTAEVTQLATTMEDMRHNLVDLTDTLRRREAQAQAMLGGISHEFRTPLAAQLASIELLRAGLGSMTVEQSAELVLSLERGVLRLTRLIDNLLENVRIESGQLNIRRQDVSLARVVEEARAMVGALLEQRHQTLEVSIPQDLPLIDGDEQRLAQVFVNLLANANKFAPENSTIRVGAQQEGAVVYAWVEDEGPGSPGIASGAIFERFNRGGQQEPRQSGLGLGLWISKSIVERHGGSITAQRTPGQRTRFTLTLPVDAGLSGPGTPPTGAQDT